MQRNRISFVVAAFLAALSATVCTAAEHGQGGGSELSGVVRDAQGVPQMGAVVELVSFGQSAARTAVTGLDGRFRFDDLIAGTYRLRASARFLRPVLTRGVRVPSGMQAVVNLTLGGLYDAGAWLPAQRRQADEPNDDWMWTMRSGASRPVLRVADAGLARRSESASGRTILPVAVAIGAQAGGFGGGGIEQAVRAGYRSADGMRQAFGDVQFGLPRQGTGEGTLHMEAAVARQSSPLSRVSSVVAYDMISDVVPLVSGSGAGSAGLRSLRVGSAETASFGDLLKVQVGGLLVSDGTRTGALASRPFGRVRVPLGNIWSIEYAGATDRTLQEAPAAGLAGFGVRPAVLARGIGRVERGRHDALLAGRQSGTRRLLVSYYRDNLEEVPVFGSGTRDAIASAMLELGWTRDTQIDGTDGAFRAEARGYRSEGCAVLFSEAMTPDEDLEVGLRTGSALAAGGGAVGSARVRAGYGMSVDVSARRRLRRTGTEVRASYDWQPERFVTAVDAFDAMGDTGYLGFALQQRLPERVAAHGAVLSVSATNLLHQGVRRIVVTDGGTVTLAQELPVLQAGLGFSF